MSRVTEGQGVSVEAAWLDGPEAFCLVYRHPLTKPEGLGFDATCGCQKVSRTLRAAGSPRETLIQMIGGWRYDCSI